MKKEIKSMSVREGFIRAKLEKDRIIGGIEKDPIKRASVLWEMDEDF